MCRSDYLLFCSCVCILSLLRAVFSGFSYIPYLDDYIQYFYYPSFEDPMKTILLGGAGTLFSRPLAGLFDFYFWSLFKNNLFVAVLIILVMHSASALIFRSALNRLGISAGKVFLALFLFCPLNTEAVYWLSASTRIVVSTFFTALALNMLLKNRYWSYAIFCFLSFWFYEQTALTAFSVLMFACIKLKKRKWCLVPFLSLILLVGYYFFAGKLGDNAHRLSMLNIKSVLSQTFTSFCQCKNILFNIFPQLIINGFPRGLWAFPNPLKLLNFVALTALCIIFFKGEICTLKPTLKTSVILGLLLTVVPLIPFFILEDSFIQLRNIAPCLLGLSILADFGAERIFKKWTPHIATALVFIFMFCWVSEVNDYKTTARHDYALASSIADAVTDQSIFVSVSLSSPKYLPQNAPYGDHIMSILGSDWGLTGVVRTLSKNKVVEVKQK